MYTIIDDATWDSIPEPCGACGAYPRVDGQFRCANCLEKKKHSSAERRARDGVCDYCSDPPEPGHTRCARHLEYHRADQNARLRDRRSANLCRDCQQPCEPTRQRCPECAIKSRNERVRNNERNRRQVLKDEVYAAYGGYVCACCGETEPLFLEIDHVNGGGSQHRKDIRLSGKPAVSFYRWLRDNGYPEGFQILCTNCNRGRYRNGGTCPHKTL